MPSVKKVMSKLLPGTWKSFYRFVRDDPSRKEKLPFGTKLSMWRRGFYANRVYFYDFGHNDSKLYVSDYFNLLSHPYNGPYSSLIDNKLYLPIYLHRFAAHLPQYYYLLTNDSVVKLRGDKSVVTKGESACWEEILAIIRNENCVLKPVNREGGEDVRVLEYRQESFLVNGSPHTKEQMTRTLKDARNCLICGYIHQHRYAQELNPTTTNTVRLLTCWDVEKNEPFIAKGFHRIGRATMYGADNGALGGLITWIDLENAVLGKIALKREGRIEYVDRHPDSGVSVCGTRIPHFDTMTAKVIEMCRELNFVRYIAWDIVITDDSFRVLELNSLTDMYGYQLFEPLLADPRLLRFYQTFVTARNRKYFMR
jgi:hypothetical protein